MSTKEPQANVEFSLITSSPAQKQIQAVFVCKHGRNAGPAVFVVGQEDLAAVPVEKGIGTAEQGSTKHWAD